MAIFNSKFETQFIKKKLVKNSKYFINNITKLLSVLILIIFCGLFKKKYKKKYERIKKEKL